MPERILRDLTDSEPFNSVDANARDLFIRLINKADDFGCYVAEPVRLRPALYPLLLDKVREADLTRWIRSLETAGLVRLYEADSKRYVFIEKWRQRLRNKRRKYPKPPWESEDSGNLSDIRTANAPHPRTESEAQGADGGGSGPPEKPIRRKAWHPQRSAAP